MSIADLILMVFSGYALVGLLFALAFAFRGAGAIDATAKSGTVGFRLLILPGAAVLWPVLLTRWVAGDRKDQA